MHDSVFLEAYRARRRDITGHVTARLQALNETAMRTLADIMDDADSPPAVRAGCARTVLEFSAKFIDQEMAGEKTDAAPASSAPTAITFTVVGAQPVDQPQK